MWLFQATVNSVVGQSFDKYPIIQSKYKINPLKIGIMQRTKNFMKSFKVMLKEPFNQTQKPSID